MVVVAFSAKQNWIHKKINAKSETNGYLGIELKCVWSLGNRRTNEVGRLNVKSVFIKNN